MGQGYNLRFYLLIPIIMLSSILESHWNVGSEFPFSYYPAQDDTLSALNPLKVLKRFCRDIKEIVSLPFCWNWPRIQLRKH